MSDERTRARFAATAERLGALADTRVASLRARIRDFVPLGGDEIALDSGTGTGPLAFALAPLVREVIAVDLVPEMLDQGRRRAGDVPNVRFVCGDACALPVEDASVDLAASSRTLHHLERPEVAIAELARVARPGGHVLVVDQIASEDGREAEAWERLERLRDPSHVRSLPDSELRRLLHASGLTLVSAELEPEERDLGTFLDLAGCDGEQRAMVFAYAGELLDRGETAGVDLERTPDGFHFANLVGWYLARAGEGPVPGASAPT